MSSDPRRENERLRAAIIKHRDQKADDRCYLDDFELYAILGDGVEPDNHVGDKSLMMANCYRFIEKRCEGGKWQSYIELEAELNEAHHLLDELGCDARHYSKPYGRGPILVPATRSLSERIKQLLLKGEQ